MRSAERCAAALRTLELGDTEPCSLLTMPDTHFEAGRRAGVVEQLLERGRLVELLERDRLTFGSVVERRAALRFGERLDLGASSHAVGHVGQLGSTLAAARGLVGAPQAFEGRDRVVAANVGGGRNRPGPRTDRVDLALDVCGEDVADQRIAVNAVDGVQRGFDPQAAVERRIDARAGVSGRCIRSWDRITMHRFATLATRPDRSDRRDDEGRHGHHPGRPTVTN